METIKKRGRPKKIQTDMGISDKDKLKQIASILPEEDPPDQVQPKDKINLKPEVIPQATGCVAKIICTLSNIVLTKKGFSPLSDQEITMLTKPINDIEIKYIPAIVSKCGDKASPFIELSMVIYMIYEVRHKEFEAKKPQETTGAPTDGPGQVS